VLLLRSLFCVLPQDEIDGFNKPVDFRFEVGVSFLRDSF
jgi:hypothetical protein